MSTSVLDGLPTDWIAVWQADDARFADLFEGARAADARRQLLRVPAPPTSDDLRWLLDVAEGPSGDGPGSLPDGAVQALARCLWARWWIFEDAARAALAVTDVLGCLAALRAWLEELALVEQLVPQVYRAEGGRTGARLAARLLLGRASDEDDQIADQVRDQSEWLRDVVAPLHAYVHPDPGGHAPVLHPEDSRAMSLALRTLVEISDRTAALGVLKTRPATTTTSAPVVRPYVDSLSDLVPLVDQLDVGPDGETLGELTEVRAELVSACVHLRLLAEQNPVPDPRDPLVVRFGLPAGDGAWQGRRPELGFPQEPVTRLTLPMTQDSWHALESALARWRGARDETAARLGYLAALCDAAVAVMLLKRSHYVEGLARALLQRNPLATGLAARGLIEHHAAVLYAASHSVKAFGKAGRGAADDDALSAVERRLLRLLIRPCDAGPDENRLCCRARVLVEKVSPLRGMLELAYPVGGPDEPVLGIWQRLSELVHGNTGALNARSSTSNDGVTKIGLIVLAQMLPLERTVDVLAEYHRLVPSLRAAQAAVSTGVPLRGELRRQHVPPFLRPGRDYEGAGTYEDPYRLLVGNHVDALEPLLENLEMTGATRRTVMIPGFGVADELSLAGRVEYVVPAPGLLPPLSGGPGEAPLN